MVEQSRPNGIGCSCKRLISSKIYRLMRDTICCYAAVVSNLLICSAMLGSCRYLGHCLISFAARSIHATIQLRSARLQYSQSVEHLHFSDASSKLWPPLLSYAKRLNTSLLHFAGCQCIIASEPLFLGHPNTIFGNPPPLERSSRDF